MFFSLLLLAGGLDKTPLQKALQEKMKVGLTPSALLGVETGEARAPTRRATFAPSVSLFVDDARRRAAPEPSLFLASVANEAVNKSTAAKAPSAGGLPLAQKLSMGTPVTGKKIKTGPVMASKNAKAERFKVFQVMGDGRCMFRALVIGLALSKGKFVNKRSEETEADTLRIAAAEALCRSSKIQDKYADSAYTVKSEYGTVDAYCQLVRTPDFWGGNAELMVLSEMLEQPITVYRPEKEARGKGRGFVPFVYYGTEFYGAQAAAKQKGGKAKKPVNLLYSRGNHYDLLV